MIIEMNLVGFMARLYSCSFFFFFYSVVNRASGQGPGSAAQARPGLAECLPNQEHGLRKLKPSCQKEVASRFVKLQITKRTPPWPLCLPSEEFLKGKEVLSQRGTLYLRRAGRRASKRVCNYYT